MTIYPPSRGRHVERGRRLEVEELRTAAVEKRADIELDTVHGELCESQQELLQTPAAWIVTSDSEVRPVSQRASHQAGQYATGPGLNKDPNTGLIHCVDL
jgi:hypothetical protein